MNRQTKWQIVFASCLLFMGAGVSAGWTAGEEGTEDKSYSYNVGFEVYYFKYEEKDIMNETGPMYGLSGELKWKFEDRYNSIFKVQARGALGQVDYSSVSTGSVDNISDGTFELRALGGADFTTSNDIIFEPYMGFGYRFLSDGLGGKTSTTGALGYDRKSNYFYLPFGIDVAAHVNADWKVKFNAEYDLFLKGHQESELGDAIAGLDTLKNTQDSGWGVRGSIQLAKVMANYDVFIEPFVRYWNIDQSDTKSITFSGTPIGAVGYEPDNTTIEAGAKVGMRF